MTCIFLIGTYIDYFSEEIKNSTLDKIPLGIEKNSLKVAYYDFENSYINFILSENNANESFLEGLVEFISAKKVDNINEVVVLDPLDVFSKTENRKYKYVNCNEDMEKDIVNLFKTVAYRNNTYKDIQEKGGELPVFEKVVCIISSMSALIKTLSPDGKEKLCLLLEKGDAKYNVNVIIADSIGRIATYSFESWFKLKVSLNDGIWLGNGLSNQFQIKISNMTKDISLNVEDGFGFIISKGKAKLVKLLSSVNNESGDIYG
jgi:S-DNA-T family DNA segregation ATPase FtsK/SpoIIIE